MGDLRTTLNPQKGKGRKLSPQLKKSSIDQIYKNKSHRDPSTENASGNCFIVTACRADLETLSVFYELRDKILLSSGFGRKFIELYYHYAPGIARIIDKSELLQKIVLVVLIKPIAKVLKMTLLI